MAKRQKILLIFTILVVGDKFHLTPFFVILGVLVRMTLLGVVGMTLAIAILAILTNILHVTPLKLFGFLLSKQT